MHTYLKDGMVYTWDESPYVFAWFSDVWEAVLYTRKLPKPVPRALETIIDNNLNPFQSWCVWNESDNKPRITSYSDLIAFVDSVVADDVED